MGTLYTSLICFANNRHTQKHLLPPISLTKFQRRKQRTKEGSKLCKKITKRLVHNTKQERKKERKKVVTVSLNTNKTHVKSKEQTKHKRKPMRTMTEFEVLKVVLRKIPVFWDV